MKRKTPSECNPTTEEQIRAKRIEKALFPEGLKLPASGPHWNALMDFLHFYVQTEHEQNVWHEYHRRATSLNGLPLVEAAANAEGLSLEEYEAREHLKQLRKFCVVNKIKLPTATPAADDEAYVLASTVWRDRFGTYKKFTAWLKKDGKAVRTRSPRENRLEIHAGDWVRFWKKHEEQEFENLDVE
jgi:hypothetical protein